MFGKLPELFAKNFVLGYFLPAAIFLLANLGLFSAFGRLPQGWGIDLRGQTELLINTTLLGLSSWLLGIILLGVNRNLIRVLEGYGGLNPLKVFRRLEVRHYERLYQQKVALDQQIKVYTEQNLTVPDNLDVEMSKVLRKLVERFPDQPYFILPTSFGNTIRAFEVYPRIMYGVDSIPAWNRLLAVVFKDYLDLIDESKAQVDFWINLLFLTLLTLMQYLGLIVLEEIRYSWVPVICLLTIVLTYKALQSAAVEWGDIFKATFDVFLPSLRSKMELPAPSSIQEERKLWGKVSQAIIFASPKSMVDRESSGSTKGDK